MAHPRPHDVAGEDVALIRQKFEADLDRPLLIVGNGPSAATPDHHLLPDDPVVFRMNWFFLEDRYWFGRRVDGWFCSISNELLEASLRCVIDAGDYEVGALFTPMKIPFGRDGETHRSALELSGVPQFDHWTAISTNPVLARYFMSRPLPTQGVQVLAAALNLGFSDITLCGIDLYASASERYGYVVPDQVVAALDAKDVTAGYEDAHSLDRDLDVFDACREQFPDAQIKHIGPSDHLRARFDTPERRHRRNTFDGVDARDLAAQAKSNRSIASTGADPLPTSCELPHREIAGRRCGYVTLVSGDFHHGARALARCLDRVSDVPLLVMATPSADRGALRRSGIAWIDVPEIHNPNSLHGASQRFSATYSKLHAFRMTHLDRAVYVDADMIVLRSIDDLFERDGFWAVPDHGLEFHYERFNSGLFAFDPDARVFERLMDAIGNVPSYDGGDQGFLNEMFLEWQRLPHEYNVNKRWSSEHPNLFHHDRVRVLHFVGVKPWQPEPSTAHDALTRMWLETLRADELVDVVESLRQQTSAPTPRVRGAHWKRVFRRSSDRSGWDSGSLLRRTQARNRDGAHTEALSLLKQEWPGDTAASAGLHRELAKTMVLSGDFTGGARMMRELGVRFPTNRAIQANLSSLDSLARLKRYSLGIMPDRWIAAMARQAYRLSA